MVSRAAAPRQLDLLPAMVENMREIALATDLDGRVVYANPAGCRALGYGEGEVAGLTLNCLFRLTPAALQGFRRSAAEGKSGTFEASALRKDGSQFPVRISLSPIRSDGDLRGMVAVAEDVTERRRAEADRKDLEEKLLQAQKLESLGVLAGGVAHDFNNLLMGILGHADLMLADLPPASPLRENLRQVQHSALRAAELTKGLLAYSGRGRFVVEALDVSKIVRGMREILAVSVSKKADLIFRLTEGLPPIDGDASQIRQIVLNLVTNASDALGEEGGEVVLETGASHCDEALLRDFLIHRELPEGEYVFLEVADTGAGMAEETRRRVFDPFFSTKFAGRGLGLAAVFGIVRGHGGGIRVESQPGQGSRFRVLFPLAASAKSARSREAGHGRSGRPSTVLVADDEETVRSVTSQVLERAGYRVILAADGGEALEHFRARSQELDAAILDLSMPRLGGEDILAEIRRIRPGIPVILTSGFDREDSARSASDLGAAAFLQKPYHSAALLTLLRETMAQAHAVEPSR